MLYLTDHPRDLVMFQSAPGREAGRCAGEVLHGVTPNSFNPRPAVRPGDAGVDRAAADVGRVSIRARP